MSSFAGDHCKIVQDLEGIGRLLFLLLIRRRTSAIHLAASFMTCLSAASVKAGADGLVVHDLAAYDSDIHRQVLHLVHAHAATRGVEGSNASNSASDLQTLASALEDQAATSGVENVPSVASLASHDSSTFNHFLNAVLRYVPTLPQPEGSTCSGHASRRSASNTSQLGSACMCEQHLFRSGQADRYRLCHQISSHQ